MPLDKNTVAVVVVNHRQAGNVLRLRQEYSRTRSSYSFFMIVVDSGSSGDDPEILRRELSSRSDTELILSPQNLGYSRGNNIGLRRAYELGIRYCFIVNPDISVGEDSNLDALVNFLQRDKRYMAAYPQVINAHSGRRETVYYNPENIFWLVIYPNLFFLFYPMTKLIRLARRRHLEKHGVDRVFSAMGCFLCLDVFAAARFGFYDEDFFLYAEEQVLGERIRRRRKYSALVYASSVRHLHDSREASEETKGRDSYIKFLRKYKRYPSWLEKLVVASKLDRRTFKRLVFSGR
jgi:GT2 family glycosyltransferase